MLAVLHASQLVTLAGPERPRVGAELNELSIIPDGQCSSMKGELLRLGPRLRSQSSYRQQRKRSMHPAKLCCRVLLTRTPIRFSAEIASMNLSNALEGRNL